MTPNDKIAEAMVKRRAGQFAFLRDLVRTLTTPSPNELVKASEKIAQMLERLGFEVERHAPAADRLDASGQAALQNLVVRSRFGDGPTLAFVSHLDTYDPSDDWSVDPFQGHIKDGTMVGSGAVSGKGHLAAQAFAILALADIGARPKGTIELHVSFDGDSGGGHGAKWLLSEEIVKPDIVIAGGSARAVATQSTGILVLDVDIRGAAVPAYAPSAGHDAMEAANQALTRVVSIPECLEIKDVRYSWTGCAFIND
jgi:acetylornithine deacetylase/succinyl-diaminopimelate desuccinylase-like protein